MAVDAAQFVPSARKIVPADVAVDGNVAVDQDGFAAAPPLLRICPADPVETTDGPVPDPPPTTREYCARAVVGTIAPPFVFTALPRAVRTPEPVVVVEGATPAPPPIMIELAASSADEDICVVLLKYGMPPLVTVPLTV